MRVFLRFIGGPREYIIGDPAFNERMVSAVLQEGLQITRNQQIVTGAGWKSVECEDRGNQKVVFTATMAREFENHLQVWDHIAKLGALDEAAQLHRWQGDVWLRVEVEDEFKEWCLPRAVISLDAVRPVGQVRLELAYRVQAGGFSESASGGIFMTSLYGFLNVGPAVQSVIGYQMDAKIASLGIAYGTGAVEILRTDAAGIVQAKSWPLAGYGSSGFGFPIGSHFATMVSQWNAEFGGGLSTTVEPGIFTLIVTSGNTGADAYVAINFFVNGVLTPWVETEGGFADPVRPLMDDDGNVLTGDLG